MPDEKPFIVLRGDLSMVVSRHATESEAREAAQEACSKTGKPFVIAQVLDRVEVERFPVRWASNGATD